MRTKYFLASAVVVFAALYRAGAPVLPLVAGIALVGLVTYRQWVRS